MIATPSWPSSPWRSSQAREPDWIDLFLEGSRALERGELVTARHALEGALKLLPEHSTTAWAIAATCARDGDRPSAFDWL